MNQHFMELTCYQTKNKAHEELQQFVAQFNKCLIDDDQLVLLKSAVKQKIVEINNEYTRCKNIELSGWMNLPNCDTIGVDGNFVLSIKKIEMYMLTPHRDPSRDLMGDMKADAS